MTSQLTPILVALGIFVGMLTFLEIGRRVGLRRLEQHGQDARAGIGVVDGAVYAVLSLLIGFTFSGAAGRYDHRREIVARAANAIGTAWNTVDMCPPRNNHPSGRLSAVRRHAPRIVCGRVLGESAGRAAGWRARRRRRARDGRGGAAGW